MRANVQADLCKLFLTRFNAKKIKVNTKDI